MGYGKGKMPHGVQLVVSLIRPALGQPWRQKPSICLISPIDRDQDRGLSWSNRWRTESISWPK